MSALIVLCLNRASIPETQPHAGGPTFAWVFGTHATKQKASKEMKIRYKVLTGQNGRLLHRVLFPIVDIS
jgi:hypothetical protein